MSEVVTINGVDYTISINYVIPHIETVTLVDCKATVAGTLTIDHGCEGACIDTDHGISGPVDYWFARAALATKETAEVARIIEAHLDTLPVTDQVPATHGAVG